MMKNKKPPSINGGFYITARVARVQLFLEQIIYLFTSVLAYNPGSVGAF
jgi:hypothetical protein